MIVMFDSTTVGEIPSNAQAVAGYVGGRFHTLPELERRFPHAHRLSIAIAASENAECLDIERSDATAEEAPAWVRRQHARGIKRPVVYANLSTMPSVLHALEHDGIPRSQFRVWSAHYTNEPHLCGPHDGLATTADATQWTERALGRNLDESLCQDGFFEAPAYVPPDEARWEHEYDQLRRRHDPWARMRRRVLIRVMTARRKLIWHLAQEHNGAGWAKLNRAARYRALLTRTGG